MSKMLGSNGPVFGPEDEGAGNPGGTGGATQPAGNGADSQPAAGANDTQAAGAADSQPAAAKPDDWKDRRIGQLTARNADLTRRLNEVAGKPALQAPATGKPLDPTQDFEARVAAQAARDAETLVALRSFNDRCNAEVDKGRAAYGASEFNTSVSGLQQLVDSSDPRSIANYQDFLESAIETGAGAALIFELGKDLNEAERLMGLAPKRRAIELARKADGIAKPDAPSNAPKPIRPIEPHGGRHEQIRASDAERADNLSTAEWMARRNAEVAANASGR